MRLLLNAIFFLFGAIYAHLYYTGGLNYTGDKELRRKERVERFGWLIIISMVLMGVSSMGLFLSLLR